MKKFYSLFLVMTVILICSACQNDSKEIKETDDNKATTVKKEAETKIYKLGEEAVITNSNGENVYSITINSVKEVTVTEEDQEYIPSGTKQNVVVDYTYKYLNKDEDLAALNIIHSDMNIYDKNNEAGVLMDLGTGYYPFDSDTKDILPGRSAQTYAVYSLKEVSDSVQIDFISDNFQQNLTFEAPIEKEEN